MPCSTGERRRGAHLPLQAIEPVGGYTTESVTHGQCDARPTVTFLAIEHHHLNLAGCKLQCLATVKEESFLSVASAAGNNLCCSRRFQSLTGQETISFGNSSRAATNNDLEMWKQELLSEVRREIQTVKLEIIEGKFFRD